MDAAAQSRLRKQRRQVLIFLYFAFLLAGAMEGFIMGAPQDTLHPHFYFRAKLLTGTLFSLGFLWLCTVDARLLGRPLLEMARLGIFLGWPAGVPIYLLWAHGLRGLGILLLHGVLLFLVTVGAMLATGYLLYGGQFLA